MYLILQGPPSLSTLTRERGLLKAEILIMKDGRGDRGKYTGFTQHLDFNSRLAGHEVAEGNTEKLDFFAYGKKT